MKLSMLMEHPNNFASVRFFKLEIDGAEFWFTPEFTPVPKPTNCYYERDMDRYKMEYHLRQILSKLAIEAFY